VTARPHKNFRTSTKPTKYSPILKNVSNTIALVHSGNNIREAEVSLKILTGGKDPLRKAGVTPTKRSTLRILKNCLAPEVVFRIFSTTCSVEQTSSEPKVVLESNVSTVKRNQGRVEIENIPSR